MKKSLIALALLFLFACFPERAQVISPLASSGDLGDPELAQALRVIQSTYGDRVSIAQKAKNLLKFGRSETIGTTRATVMTLPTGLLNETFVSTNLITHAASGNSGDTQASVIEGHTCSGGIPSTFVVQDFTFAGQTKTALTTPLCRVTRLYNNSSTNFTGPLYVAENVTFTSGVPQTNTAIHLQVPAGENQSFKASTALSSQDYWILTGFHCSVLEKTAASVDVRLEVRLAGKVFRPISGSLGCASPEPPSFLPFKPYLIVPPSSDIRLRALASGANTDVSGGIQGYLAIVES